MPRLVSRQLDICSGLLKYTVSSRSSHAFAVCYGLMIARSSTASSTSFGTGWLLREEVAGTISREQFVV